MRKLVLLCALAFIGCSTPDQAEEVSAKNCNCTSYTETRTYNFNTGTDTGYNRNGASSFYSNWCYDDGKIYGGSSTQHNGVETYVRKVVECK